MAKLTEGMVIGRTRATDLSSVRKLNCWGSELSDVSLVRQMTNVEVLSLSVNQITQLVDFSYCPNLAELYVRKNLITDLNQILCLRELPKLRHFWLEDNPCAVGDRYRLTVLKYLPNLKKLDNITVNAEEVRDAVRYGLDLDLDKPSSQQRGGESPTSTSDGTGTTASSSPSIPVSGSPSPPATGKHLSSVAERDNGLDVEGNICPSHGADTNKEQHQHRRSTGGVFFDSKFRFHEANNTNTISVADHSPADDRPTARMTRSRSETTVTSSATKRENTMSPATMDHLDNVDDRPALPPPSVIQSSRERDYHDVPSQPHHHVTSASQQHQHITSPPQQQHYIHSDVYADPPDDHHDLQQPPRFRDDVYRYPAAPVSTQQQQIQHFSPLQSPLLPPSPQQHPSHQSVLRHHTHAALLDKFLDSPSKPYPVRPKNRNSNILSAVLCLIKELDCASLEVVEMAARCRMQELDDVLCTAVNIENLTCIIVDHCISSPSILLADYLGGKNL